MMVGFGLAVSPAVNAANSDVATLTVVSQKAPHMLVLDGTLEAVKSATVSAQTSGRIVKLNFDVNDLVPAGAPLLEITSKEQGAELAAAEADYAKAQALNVEAQKTLARYEKLFPQGAISKGTMDQAIANAKSTKQAASAASAQVTKARESLKYTVVSAPYAGVVTQRHVEVGETVSPGQALLSGYATDKMRAVIQVPQRYRGALIKAGAVKVTLADGREFDVTNPVIFGFTDTQSHAYKVRLPLPDDTPALLPGSWIKARFQVDEREITLIPQTALYSVNELSGVYLKQGDKFVLQQVRLGETRGNDVEVLAGLQAGDVIATNAYQVLLTHPVQQ
ncbi:efflux RND transporter periplasmic adaptor subunit [Shewanella yunxiaonensis]|uniref:Efflux RND transporter periplasmic adaptor subunit n=2 Tax=Shewanella yunxiaonensis TaxID=2829809 RepID=A0ABX7YY55_9GAMM|nr:MULTISPECIES: efflux RND transporter periplasmic adaptor subunit [Shewanella]MDF0533604.1 efflux RND transporter periplasmic adaptor subunit [Shewanella sp. A32]QUN07615.1 efflux RND transporter periplasmic adaptor subunit [Shewanella yunxiaonensis]